jgi:hypothetical protein
MAPTFSAMLPVAHNHPRPATRPYMLRGLTLQNVFKSKSGQGNRRFWVIFRIHIR